MMRENELAECVAARALALCEEHGFPNEAAYLRKTLDGLRAQLGHEDGSIELIQRGLAELRRVGSLIGMPGGLNGLAATQMLAGRLGDALETLAQAEQATPEELMERPDTLRLRGEVRFKMGQADLAEGDFRKSIALAQKPGAKAWELRSTLSLARLLASQGRRERARAMLVEIYDWFTEGFDTPDLKDARALLDQLT